MQHRVSLGSNPPFAASSIIVYFADFADIGSTCVKVRFHASFIKWATYAMI